MEELQVNELLTRNRELQQEQNVNLETLSRWAMEFQQWAHDQINRLRQELEKTHDDGMEVHQELKHKIGEVKVSPTSLTSKNNAATKPKRKGSRNMPLTCHRMPARCRISSASDHERPSTPLP